MVEDRASKAMACHSLPRLPFRLLSFVIGHKELNIFQMISGLIQVLSRLDTLHKNEPLEDNSRPSQNILVFVYSFIFARNDISVTCRMRKDAACPGFVIINSYLNPVHNGVLTQMTRMAGKRSRVLLLCDRQESTAVLDMV